MTGVAASQPPQTPTRIAPPRPILPQGWVSNPPSAPAIPGGVLVQPCGSVKRSLAMESDRSSKASPRPVALRLLRVADVAPPPSGMNRNGQGRRTTLPVLFPRVPNPEAGFDRYPDVRTEARARDATRFVGTGSSTEMSLDVGENHGADSTLVMSCHVVCKIGQQV